MSAQLDAVVIGAGISGLSTAHYLSNEGLGVAVVERGKRPGGVIETDRRDGFLCEYGPNSALDSSGALSRLVSSLGIEDRVAGVSESAKKRFVLKNGELCLLPMSPPALISSKLFSAGGKFRLLAEPFKARGEVNDEESLADFVRRRFGPEAVDYGADPFVSGVYAGDPNQIGVRSAFPAMAQYEDEAGSVIKGAIRAAKQRKKEGGARASMVSFDEGMQVLTDALYGRLDESTRFDCDVLSIARDGEEWTTTITSPDGDAVLRSKSVVLSTPATLTAQLIESLSPSAAAAFRDIPYAGIAVVHLGYPVAQVGHDLDGFGLLVPSCERRRILGILFSSTLFPHRAPEGSALLTVMMGGARGADLLDESDAALIEIAMKEVGDILAVTGSPSLSQVRRKQKAIPQYTTKHKVVDDAVRSLEADNPGLVVAANYSGGVSVPDCIATAERIARRLAQARQEPSVSS